ncbi:MAG: hypothetical protein L7V88_01865 [Alphaproteobacteria bacterium]|nr:hypothetical protein [Alphaproteobacteria bacterium]
MYFDPVLELSTSVLSKVDNWMFSNFEIMISLADNTERVVVGVFALIVIGILMVLLASDLSRKNKPQNLDAEEKSKPVLQSSSEHIPSLASANGSSEDTDNEAKDVGKQTESKADVPKDDITAADKPNIYELDNGFVINKRSADTQDAVKFDGNSDDKQEDNEKNAVETNAEPLSLIADSDKNVSVELATIETEMLDVRKEYKSGKISSTDYLTKTQELYKKGEMLVHAGGAID